MTDLSQTLSRGLQLLSLIADAGEGVSARQLSLTTGLPRTIVQRLLNTLEAEDFIEPHPSRTGYKLSMKLWRLGTRALSDVTLRESARPSLEALARKTSETAKLSLLDEQDVVSVERVDCSQALRAYVPIGGRAPARTSATGKAILAFREKSALAFSPKEKAEFELIRRRGYAINRGDWDPAVGAVAAPVFDHRAEVIASIGVILPLSRLTSAKAITLGACCVEAASDLSKRLGYEASEPDHGSRRFG